MQDDAAIALHTADPFAYERRMLRFMLEAKQPGGLAVVHAEGLLRELVEELDGDYRNDPDWRDIQEWAFGDDGKGPVYGAGYRLGCRISCAYRVMVGAIAAEYHPDWLCVLPSHALGRPDFKAWDRFGRRIV